MIMGSPSAAPMEQDYSYWFSRDSNVEFALKNGVYVLVVQPERIGLEFLTPWLNSEGSRIWNVDINQDILNPDYKMANVIVGRWGTGYRSEDFRVMFPVRDINVVYPLDPTEEWCVGHSLYLQSQGPRKAEIVIEKQVVRRIRRNS